MIAAKMAFYQKPTYTTCRKAKSLLQELKLDFTSRDLDKQRLSETELDQLIGARDYTIKVPERSQRALSYAQHG
jgi:arsenate reductase-like glutaredoxin family protein